MKKEDFKEILNTIENDDIEKFAERVLDMAPAYWYSVPASSTGKYHPSYALGDGGLVRHTMALLRIMNHMFNVASFKELFTSRERDLLRVAGLAHDMMKSGTQDEYEKSKWTKFEHPILAARMIQDIDGLSKDEKIFIGKAIASHMGEWNTDKRSSAILPTPSDKYQILLHLCDYLASRKDIEVVFDNVPTSVQEETPDINTWKFTFGKYAGMTIPEVAEKDKGYISWAKSNMEKEPAKTLLKNFKFKEAS